MTVNQCTGSASTSCANKWRIQLNLKVTGLRNLSLKKGKIDRSIASCHDNGKIWKQELMEPLQLFKCLLSHYANRLSKESREVNVLTRKTVIAG